LKVLIFAHQLEIGGTQTNAIELAAALRDRLGHDVVIFATPGPATALIERLRLRYIPAPDAFVHPSPSRLVALREVVRRERPDIIHAWDWWQCLDAFYIEHLIHRVPLVVSDMMMSVARVLPKSVSTTFGIPELVDAARAAGRQRVGLLLPPVDVTFNAPGAVDPAPFRQQHGLRDDEINLVTVSRIDLSVKAESLRRTVAAVQTLGRELPLRFTLVGDGQGRAELEQLAAAANSALGRTAVVIAGPLVDPRPAYAAADIVVGMGGSILRAMAFGKPAIVVGAKGFSEPFNATTAPGFYRKGMYGIGDGSVANDKHAADIRTVASQTTGSGELGSFSRDFVVRHFALDTVATQLSDFCAAAVNDVPSASVRVADAIRTAAVCVRERRLLSYRFWDRVKGVR